MKPTNVLFIMSDEHSPRVLGCHGNEVIKTPNMDRLAERGTLFTDGYCNSTICVPSRASFATGRYVHDIRFWDNGIPYDGSVPGWGHRLMAEGHRVTSIGKLHYRASEDPNGFDEEIMPLHVLNGVGDLQGMLRHDPPVRNGVRTLAERVGRGESSYTDYDRKIAAAACDWLRNEAPRHRDKPWMLFVSFVCPHFPLIAPEKFYDMYPLDRVPWPRLRKPEERPNHPVIQALRRVQCYDDYFEDEEHIRRAIAAYYGMVSFLDDNIGRVLAALDACGLTEETRIVYSSDHGDNLGTRTMWGKSTMYRESVGVPMILAGPDVPAGRVVAEPVSLVDGYQTIVEGVGLRLTEQERADLPGHSLLRMANGEVPERTVLSEYHAVASITGCFMIRHGKWKYVHYVGYRPQLFDLEADPGEAHDLGDSPDHGAVLAECEKKLRAVVDPEKANAQAFADQEARIAAFGGREAVLKRGSFPYTPAPGEAATIR